MNGSLDYHAKAMVPRGNLWYRWYYLVTPTQKAGRGKNQTEPDLRQATWRPSRLELKLEEDHESDDDVLRLVDTNQVPGGPVTLTTADDVDFSYEAFTLSGVVLVPTDKHGNLAYLNGEIDLTQYHECFLARLRIALYDINPVAQHRVPLALNRRVIRPLVLPLDPPMYGDSKATIKPKKVNGKWQFLYLEEDPAIRWVPEESAEDHWPLEFAVYGINTHGSDIIEHDLGHRVSVCLVKRTDGYTKDELKTYLDLLSKHVT